LIRVVERGRTERVCRGRINTFAFDQDNDDAGVLTITLSWDQGGFFPSPSNIFLRVCQTVAAAVAQLWKTHFPQRMRQTRFMFGCTLIIFHSPSTIISFCVPHRLKSPVVLHFQVHQVRNALTLSILEHLQLFC